MQDTGPKEQDPKANLTRRELQMHELNNGVEEIQKMIYKEQKFLKFLKKKAEQNEWNLHSSDSEYGDQTPKKQPAQRMKRRAKYLEYNNRSRLDESFDETELMGKTFKNDLLKSKFVV